MDSLQDQFDEGTFFMTQQINGLKEPLDAQIS